MKKQIIGLLVCVCAILLSMLCVYASDIDDLPIDTSCGEGLTWKVEGNTLTVSGEGYLNDYAKRISNPPWYKMRNQITQIIIEDGVEYIGAYIFYDSTCAVSVTIADSVETIELHAFPETLEDIHCVGENPKFSCKDGLLIKNLGNEHSDYTGPEIISCYRNISGEYTIPDGIVSIGYGAFGNQRELTKIIMPDTLKEIGDDAFRNCFSLSEVIFSDSAEIIGEEAFESCQSLTNIKIPSGVKEIGWLAFYKCYNLESVDVSEDNQYFCSLDGVLYNKDKTEILLFPPQKAGSFIIPEGIIEADLSDADNLTSIFIPATITSIRCPNGCLQNIEVDSNNSVYAAKDGILYSKDFSTLIYYPSAKTDENFIIPDSVSEVKTGTFSECINIKKLTISKNVKKLPMDINVLYVRLSGLPNVEDYYVDAENEYFCDIDGVLFNKEKTELLDFPDGKSGEYIVPEGVEYICNNAFEECPKITKVSIPKSVKTIGFLNFYLCRQLKSIIIPDSVSNIEGGCFERCENLTIYCNKNSYAHQYAADNELSYTLLNAEVTNNSEGNKEITFTPEIYDVQEVQNVVAIPVIFGESQSILQTEQLTVTDEKQTITLPEAEQGSIVKIFLWESLESMKPLGEPIIAVIQ